MTTTSRTKKVIAAGTLTLAGFGTGAAVMVAGSASADDTGGAASDAGRDQRTRLGGDPPHRGDARPASADAVLAEYPDATIDRAETDNGGVYEAHITTADGERLTVLVGEDFAVTGTETGGRGGPGRPVATVAVAAGTRTGTRAGTAAARARRPPPARRRAASLTPASEPRTATRESSRTWSGSTSCCRRRALL